MRTPDPRACLKSRLRRSIVCVAAVALTGCWGGPSPDAAERNLAGGSGLAAVRTPGSVNGIEVRIWTIDPLGAPLSGSIAPFESGSAFGEGLDPADTGVWRDQGFRILEIPVELVGELESTLPHVDAVRRLWLGQPLKWAGLASRTIESDGGALGGRPTPVRVMLSVRSWIEPGIRRRPIRAEFALTGIPLDGTETDPILLRELLLSHRLEPGVALMIVPASPDEVWVSAADRDESDAVTSERPVQPGRQGRPQRPVDIEEDPVGPIRTAESVGLGRDPAPPLIPEDGLLTQSPPAPERASPGLAAAGPEPELPQSLGELMLFLPNRIASRPPRPAREVLVIVPSSR